MRPGGGEWDVVVTHPVSLAKPASWGFMRVGLPFRAKMVDDRFLAAIRAGNEGPLRKKPPRRMTAKSVDWSGRS